MLKVKSKCVFCQVDLTLSIDPTCPGDRLEKLVPIAACNRCGDFRHKIRSKEDAVKSVCEALAIGRAVHSRQLPELEGHSRDALLSITKAIHAELCYFYRVQEGWSSEFAQLLFDKPDRWNAILRANEDSLRKMKNLPQMPAGRSVEQRPVTNDP